ncbi:membrane-bound lytic murein transglycosylase F [Thiohalobacter sp. COW1]|uniref:membrane-bound lytic murein transglycosylase MltF n=1 Tax=Thiohalobacter sp. COW1 TaxID=2795687 RepID=UPI0019150F28|nr:membrane-bound lytic murein transglycosylase MltF [Thiohalobacter sp. COW1]BCO30201.1 membrane-bound lytic murein transglycosylase F [Thiohalobacter sp. COW1]
MYFRAILLLPLVMLLMSPGCSRAPDSGIAYRDLASIRESGKLVVLTRNAPTTWYIGRDDAPTGPEHDMVEAFAAHLGVEAEYRVKAGVPEILQALEAGEGDLAAAGLTRLDSRREQFAYGPAYQDVTQQVVCRRDNVQPETVEELVGLELEVIADSSYSRRLQQLRQDHPRLEWQETAERTTEELLRAVWERELDCTVADSTIVDINRRYFPELITPMNLARAQSLGWMLARGNDSLQRAVHDWFEDFSASGRLASLQERYYGFFEVFDYVDIRTYIRRIDARFPEYRGLFRQAAEEYGLPYTVLAAQGYQESHWNARARSPTGVRGIMMLTLSTARAMGVENRLDPEQSIFGGARYLARMMERFSDEVTGEDRLWLALAAYNLGRAHMHDAQVLARRLDLSPHHWRDLKQVLPLLAKKEYYKDLKYGYARGTEPVRYVQRIREYRHVLENHLE